MLSWFLGDNFNLCSSVSGVGGGNHPGRWELFPLPRTIHLTIDFHPNMKLNFHVDVFVQKLKVKKTWTLLPTRWLGIMWTWLTRAEAFVNSLFLKVRLLLWLLSVCRCCEVNIWAAESRPLLIRAWGIFCIPCCILICFAFFFFFFLHRSKGETIQHKLVRSALWFVFLANSKDLNCREKSPIDPVALHTQNCVFGNEKETWRTFVERETEPTHRCDNWEFPEVYFPNVTPVDYLQRSYSALSINISHSSRRGGGAFNHIVLKGSTLTSVTMLINRTFPFCGRPQRATLSVSVAESPHSLGPIHVFPMLQFTHWIRLGPKKSVSVPIIIWQGGEAARQGWGWDT